MLLAPLRRRAVTATAWRAATAAQRGMATSTTPHAGGWGAAPMDAPYQGRNTSKISLGIK